MDYIEPYSPELFKMMIIYNALLNGWSVKMIAKNKFEFSNNNRKVRKEFHEDNFIKEFIEKNMVKNSTENIA